MSQVNLRDRSLHPCFNYNARHKYARVHLPVAPSCNIQCKFCNRCFSCLNESRPGVTSEVLSPQQALHYLDRVMEKLPNLSVAGIAGPGDAFATPEKTLEVLRLIKARYPQLLFCIATNGFNVLPYVEDLIDCGVTHITVTVNAVDPVIGKEIYAWAREGARIYRGEEAARILMERQLEAVERFSRAGVTVKVNAIVIPGVNDHHIADIARDVAVRGAHTFNAMPIYPVQGTLFEDINPPTAKQMEEIRSACKEFLHQMTHCRRCRADAAGLLSEAVNSPQVQTCLEESAMRPLDPGQNRPYIAVASESGLQVDQHLGQTKEIFVYLQEGQQFRLIQRRETPAQGGGDSRWDQMSELLTDCHALVVLALGRKPQDVLTKNGVKIYQAQGEIVSALEHIFNTSELESRRRFEPTGCPGLGDGKMPTGCSQGSGSDGSQGCSGCLTQH